MNFTRNGKIARLPRAVRAELNQRLAESETADSLLPWLNSLPEVQHVLTTHFAAQPISEQNLSAWRQGGFTEWERAEGAREWAERLVEDCQDLEGISGQRRLAERMAIPILMELMQLLQTASTHENLAERRRTVLGVARQITQLTRTGHETERLDMERARWKYEEHKRDVEELTEMTTRVWQDQMIEETLAELHGETGEDPDEDEPGDELAPEADLGEEQEQDQGQSGTAESNAPQGHWSGATEPIPLLRDCPEGGRGNGQQSSPIKVNQGNTQPAKPPQSATNDPREILRQYELQTLRGKLMATQAMPFRELITGRNHDKKPTPKPKPRSRSRSSSSKTARKTKGSARKKGAKKKPTA